MLPAELLSRFPCAPIPLHVKGEPTIAFDGQKVAGVSPAVYCGDGNAASIAVYVSGSGASADLAVLGAPSADATFLPLIDPGATRTVTGSLIFDVVVGAGYVKVQLSNVVGTFGQGQGITVVITPYVSPGPPSVQAKVG